MGCNWSVILEPDGNWSSLPLLSGLGRRPSFFLSKNPISRLKKKKNLKGYAEFFLLRWKVHGAEVCTDTLTLCIQCFFTIFYFKLLISGFDCQRTQTSSLWQGEAGWAPHPPLTSAPGQGKRASHTVWGISGWGTNPNIGWGKDLPLVP